MTEKIESFKPLKLGDTLIDFPVGLAPMAGITDQAYREIAAKFGSGFVVSEMVSGKALTFDNERTKKLMETSDREGIVGLQLFGSEPDVLKWVAQEMNDSPFAFFDINMGCPAPKIVKNKEGSALMEDPKLAADIVREVVKVSKKPVTVKTRVGFTHKNKNCVEIAKRVEDAGASAICIHGRTRSDYYEGVADWSYIKAVKEAVGIPVFGNGDIVDGKSAVAMKRETGCDGILVGRAAQGNPWIFEEIRNTFDGKEVRQISNTEKLEVCLEHLALHREYKGEEKAFLEMRKHFSWYLRGMEGAARIRAAINVAKDIDEMTAILEEYLIE